MIVVTFMIDPYSGLQKQRVKRVKQQGAQRQANEHGGEKV
jgi:hypothetical protein